MPKRNKVTISFSLPIDSINCFEKLAKAENKTNDQLFEDMLDFYTEKKVEGIVHEVRAECEAGSYANGKAEKEIEEMILKIKGN